MLSLLVTGVIHADTITLDNQTPHPDKQSHSKMAIQWAYSAKDIDEGNTAMLHGLQLNSKTLEALTQSGKVTLNIPAKEGKPAEYFRIVIWSNGEGDPDLHTNWVDISPDKTYILKSDHLVPTVLMAGTGC